jgi:hypothetical protein
MNKVQDIVAPQWNAPPNQQQQQNTRIGGSNNELKLPMPEHFGSEEQRRVSKISTGPMG